MVETLLPWILFLVYVAVIVYVSWYNSRKAKTFRSFSIGNRDVSPVFVGLSLAANMTSAATFVINPGLVYAYGVAGLVGYSVATPLGIFLGLTIFTKSFRRLGEAQSVITVPQWVGSRFQEKRLTVYLAVVSLLQITFLVLIVVGLSHVMANVFQIPALAAALMVIVFTFTYMFFGGATAHIWTNSIQAGIKIVVAIVLLVSGALIVGGDWSSFVSRLSSVGPHYADLVNPDSKLFRDYFEVFAANFLIGVAIVTQPHIISKALFLRSEKDVNTYLVTAMITEVLFFSVLGVGLFARVALPAQTLSPDKVMSTYIMTMFSPVMRSVIMLGILASGFSTMEGILLSLSSIFSNDFYRNVFRDGGQNEEERKKKLLRVSKIFIAVLAPVTFAFSYQQIVDPSLSVAIFAQNGVYGLIAATFAPILFGIFSRRATGTLVFTASVVALAVHFGMYYGKITMYHNNPAVPASCAIVASAFVVAAGLLVTRNTHPTHPITKEVS